MNAISHGGWSWHARGPSPPLRLRIAHVRHGTYCACTWIHTHSQRLVHTLHSHTHAPHARTRGHVVRTSRPRTRPALLRLVRVSASLYHVLRYTRPRRWKSLRRSALGRESAMLPMRGRPAVVGFRLWLRSRWAPVKSRWSKLTWTTGAAHKKNKRSAEERVCAKTCCASGVQRERARLCARQATRSH
jgi:hypothetical protein